MNRARLGIRLAWTLVCATVVVWAFQTRPELLDALNALVGRRETPLVLLLLVLAKLGLAAAAHSVLLAAERPARYADAFRAYSLSQLGKYIPGGIWQFLGRHRLNRNFGLEGAASARVIACETALLASSAAVAAMLLAAAPLLVAGIDVEQSHLLLFAGATSGTVGIIAFALAARIGRIGWQRLLPPYAWFYASWAGLGLSVALLLPEVPVALAAPAYALSFLTGMAAPFAPAGLGVREGAFVLLATPSAPLDTALAAMVLHRAVYTFVDLLMGVLASAISPSAAIKGVDTSSTPPENR